MNYRKLSIFLFLLLIISLSMPGCNSSPEANSEPTPGIDVDTSFPNGAPPLNQTDELVCTISNHESMLLHNMSVDITLPEGFELVSGELSWLGNIPEGDEVEVISAVIKAVKVGNWTIDVTSYLDPEKHGGTGSIGAYDVYVTVTENSAEWALWRFWDEVDPSAVEIEQRD